MTELKRTLIFGGVALGLMLLAFISAPRPKTPEAFSDRGTLFFPEFDNPNTAKTLEVIRWDEQTGSAVPFKVTFTDGKWTIPSHYDYPADGEDRLAKTAAGVIGIKKDDFRTDNPAQHASFNLLDPLDETETSLTGRGERVTIKGDNEKVLADFIIGKKVPERDKMRFVRLPGKKRVYAVRMDIDISTKFSDWIEADLLKVEKDKIASVKLKDYSIDERTGRVQQRDEVNLTKDGAEWGIDKLKSSQELDKTKMNEFLTALDELSIVGVRTKPPGLSASLKKAEDGVSITQQDMLNLQSKGFYFARNGQLLSNEGEVEAVTSEGVRYTVRFGEIVYGSGLEVSAGGSDESRDASQGPGENRYLFISADFIDDMFEEPKAPANTEFQAKADSLWSNDDHANKALFDAHEEWKRQVDQGRTQATELNNRFANWYYVISSESFDKLHLNRGDLVKTKEDK